jgi:MFS family permease
MVAELVTNPEHQAKGYAVMPFVWNVGTIVGPAIGGFFYDWFSKNERWSQYPALMPNLVCAGFLMAAVLIGAFFIEETHPDFSADADADKDESSEYYSDDRPLLGNSGAIDQAPADLRDDHYGTFNHAEVRTTYKDSTGGEKAFNRRVIMLVIALGIFTFHSMAYDNLIPIFFQDHRGDPDLAIAATKPDALTGGLGLSTQHVGVIMMFNGLIALLIQAVAFPAAASYFGIWKSFLLVTILHPIAYVIVPFLAFIPGSSSGLLSLSIYSCLTVRNLFGILAYPLVLILLKDACPGPAYLGRINGLAASVGAASRTIASPVAGALYTVGIQADFTALPWLVTAAIAVLGAVQIFFVGRQENEAEVHVESAVANIAHRASVSHLDSE